MSDARQAILDIIREKHSFAIMTHREPDGDALGSSFALGRFLERIGKSVIYYAREPMPKTIGGFLPNYRGFENRLSWPIDALFVLDCAIPHRLGKAWSDDEGFLNQYMTINIDHHISNTHFGNISLIDSTSASTSLMVYDLLLAYDPSKIDTEIANAILMGTLTDTGAFQNLNTDPKTLRITASLIEKWADYHAIIKTCFQSHALSLMTLIPDITQRFFLFQNQRVIWLVVEKHLLVDWVDREDAVSSFILRNILMTLDADILFLILELPNGEKKLSFRSKQGHYDVNALAAHFWWGGHAAAAGARTRLETREILRMIEKIEVPNKTLS